MSKIKDTIIEEQDTGVNVYGNKTPYLKPMNNHEHSILHGWARNERERNGISRTHFSDNQISPNPFDR